MSILVTQSLDEPARGYKISAKLMRGGWLKIDNMRSLFVLKLNGTRNFAFCWRFFLSGPTSQFFSSEINHLCLFSRQTSELAKITMKLAQMSSRRDADIFSVLIHGCFELWSFTASSGRCDGRKGLVACRIHSGTSCWSEPLSCRKLANMCCVSHQFMNVN